MNRLHAAASAPSLCLLGALAAVLPMLPLTPASAAEKDPNAAVKQNAPGVRVRPEIGAYLPPAPANVTLTAVSPANIRIEWSPVAGAVRYAISRNGAADIPIDANAGYLQGARFVYTDVGRRPATLQTYSVAAQFPAPTPSSRSAPVQTLTPAALAPQSFQGSISGPNSITLRWGARPEAAGYRLIRNGGNLPPVEFIAPGPSYVDQNLPAGTYSYVLNSIVRLASGEEVSGERSSPVTVALRPFNMLAIGDSVMWGQGLLPQNKFAFKVRDWIASQIGKPVDLRLWAHSGAITYPEPGQPVYENRSYFGEVPADWPTISHQISLASSPSVAGQPPASEIDLVLIDGCANNLGILTVINPFTNDEALRNGTRAYCGAGMTNLLREVVRKFPNADVIVTGYFPYVSRESDEAALLPIFALFGGIPTTVAYRDEIAIQSDVFFQESTSSLQAAVNTVNGETFPGRTRFNQIRYAHLNAGPKNAYAAPNSWQFLIPGPPFAQDEVYEARRAECYRLYQEARGNPDLLPGEHIRCIQASMGHPNAAGAQAYTDAIRSVAAQFVPAWRTTTVRDDSIVVRAQPDTQDSSGGTLVVTATDAVSGAPLPGSVQFNGLAAGALGASARYSYPQNNPAEIVASVIVPDRQPRYFFIPPRTFSVAVNVTNSGDPRTALVTAADTASGQVLSGTVTVRSNTANTVGQTGQPLTYPSCGPAAPVYQFANRPIDPAPCFGTVSVPFYPEVAYQDVPGSAPGLRIGP